MAALDNDIAPAETPADAGLATAAPVPRPPPRRRSTRRPAARRLALALQGGGSFGAFTWGVLDRLLDEPGLAFDAIGGASAGAVNAVVLASALAAGGPAEARAALARLWRRVSDAAPPAAPGAKAAIALSGLSPYQFNPFNINPLDRILAAEVDFAAIRRKPPLRLLIAATRVSDGTPRIFRERELTLEAVLASACVPTLHHAVTVDGEAYWDGGYSANPPLIPLVAATRAADALIVQIIPTAGDVKPTSAPDIAKRMQQITFSSSLVRDMAALADLARLSDGAGTGPGKGTPLSRKLGRLRLHHLAAEKQLPDLARASALDLRWDFLTGLRDAGSAAADAWLNRAWRAEAPARA